MTRSWIGVASASHVETGVAGGFCQLGHGKLAPLQRLSPGDGIAYYSPRTALKGGEPVCAFTAIGEVAPGEAYRVEQAPRFAPFRRDVARRQSARPAPIPPLLVELEFTRDKGRHWGMALRRSVIEISRADLERIAQAMGAPTAA